jgi:hypothetical protein
MASFTISSFKFGLDTRKELLTSQPGTLATCENAHINPGGEVEKRKAFVEFANTAILDGAGNTGVFGLESTDAGLIVFGSALLNGQSDPTGQSRPNLASAIPAGVTYQRLDHPDLFFDLGQAYSATYHRMVQIVFSENFNGKAFVAAKFTDGNTFLYYDGSFIRHSASGLNLHFAARTEDLTIAIRDIGWNATPDVDEFGNQEDGSVIIDSPQNDYFTPIAEYTTAAGRIGIKNISQDVNGTAGTRAVAGFKITVDSGTYLVFAPLSASGAAPTVNLTEGAVVSSGVIATTVAAIARSINDFTSVHGYTALATADSVFVYAPVSFGNMTFNLSVTTTTATLAAAGAAPTALAGVIIPSPLDVTLALTRNRITTVKGDVQMEASGGTAPYTFLWAEASTGSGYGIAITQASGGTSANNVTAAFSKALSPNTTVKGNFKCTITDNVAATVIVFLTVSLTASYRAGQ